MTLLMEVIRIFLPTQLERTITYVICLECFYLKLKKSQLEYTILSTAILNDIIIFSIFQYQAHCKS